MKFRKQLLSKEIRLVSKFIQDKTGVLLKQYYVEQLLTRSSFPYSARSESNEIFEFYGDSILSYVTVKKMYEHYGSLRTPLNDEWDDLVVHVLISHEKNRTDLKNAIVSNENLAKIVDSWAEEGFNILDYMLVGKCDIDNNVDHVQKIKADVFEAIIGAIAVQMHYDDDIVYKAVSKMIPFESLFLEYDRNCCFRPENMSIDNAISTLEEMADKGYCSRAKYGGNKEMFPVNLPWCKSCEVKEWGLPVTVYSKSKQEAKRAAAYIVLCQRFEMANEYGPSRYDTLWTYVDGELKPY